MRGCGVGKSLHAALPAFPGTNLFGQSGRPQLFNIFDYPPPPPHLPSCIILICGLYSNWCIVASIAFPSIHSVLRTWTNGFDPYYTYKDWVGYSGPLPDSRTASPPLCNALQIIVAKTGFPFFYFQSQALWLNPNLSTSIFRGYSLL